MDKHCRSVLKSLDGEHLSHILELYGINTINDMSQMSESTPDEIEQWVRDGKYEGMIDAESKEVRVKFFLHDFKKMHLFNFKVFDMNKLKKLGELARHKLIEK